MFAVVKYIFTFIFVAMFVAAISLIREFYIYNKTNEEGIQVDQYKLNEKYKQIFYHYDELYHQNEIDHIFHTISDEWYETKKKDIIERYEFERDNFLKQLSKCPDISDDVMALINNIENNKKERK